MSLKINVGCGRSPTDGWLNFDNSPSIRLAASRWRYVLAKSLSILDSNQIKNIEWNRTHNIQFADACKHIPVNNGAASAIYTSHMLEHLSRKAAVKFLAEALRVLEPGGVLRIGVPDLRRSVNRYLNDGDADAFMTDIFVAPPALENWQDKARLLVSGFRHHQWMYDGPSLTNLMASHGFVKVEMCPPGMTKIEDPGHLDLWERSEETVFVEGAKPSN